MIFVHRFVVPMVSNKNPWSAPTSFHPFFLQVRLVGSRGFTPIFFNIPLGIKQKGQGANILQSYLKKTALQRPFFYHV